MTMDTQMEDWIPEDYWKIIVQNMPIVSVDLIVLHNGGVLLGKRRNEPAKGEWFVPGGRLKKGERLEEAVHRIAKEEVGTDVEIEDMLGVYEHFYDTSEIPDAGKHYVTIAFIVTPINEKFVPDSQHVEFRVFNLTDDLHPYVKQYMVDLSKRGYLR